MTARLFSVIRRRPNYVDIVTPFTYGSDGYRLKWGTNFDVVVLGGNFTTIITATNVGYVDPAINTYAIDAQPMGGFMDNGGRNVRIVFNPATFSIPDTSSFWLQFVQTVGGVEQTPGAPTLVLPPSANHGVGINTIHGTAPSATSSAGALQIDLPRLMEDFHIHNEDSANYLFVSTEAGGPETALQPDTFSQFSMLRGTQGSLWVRGATSANVGAQVKFSATFTLAFPR